MLPVCCPSAGQFRLNRQQKRQICREFTKTGATGLEPATSGVTGRFGGHDDGRRWTRNRSIHAGVGATSFRMVERSRFRTFAALLLPGADRDFLAMRRRAQPHLASSQRHGRRGTCGPSKRRVRTFVGVAESQGLEFKREPHRLRNERRRFDLARDAAGLGKAAAE
jgi:hypothetical protein